MTSEHSAEPRKGVRSLGPLEAQLMEALWASPTPLSVQETCDRLGPGHNYKTVMTVLNRLVEKELLERELDGRAYKYQPRQTRDAFLEAVADDLVHGYVGAYGHDSARHLATAVSTLTGKDANGLPLDHLAGATNGSAPAHADNPARTTPVSQATPSAAPPPAYPPPAYPPADDLSRLLPFAILLGAVALLQVIILLRIRR